MLPVFGSGLPSAQLLKQRISWTLLVNWQRLRFASSAGVPQVCQPVWVPAYCGANPSELQACVQHSLGQDAVTLCARWP